MTATQPEPPPTDRHDPLHAALANALRPHGITNPEAITAAALAALAILGRDRCVCRIATHSQHHNTPVADCPWCTRTEPTPPATPGTTNLPTGEYL